MKTYTIQEITTLFSLSSSTLRYYEQAGLLPKVERNSKKQRIYTQEHICRIQSILCFKRTGLPISKMLKFFSYESNLENNIDNIIQLLSDHEVMLKVKIEEIQKDLLHIHQKIEYSLRRDKSACAQCVEIYKKLNPVSVKNVGRRKINLGF